MAFEPELILRVVVGFLLAYIFGFERHLRGSPAGDRTFSLVGASAAAITAVCASNSRQAVAGVVTGVGFIGAGVVLHSTDVPVRGVTTAAAILAAAAIGVVSGYGHITLAIVMSALLLLTLEIEHIPFLRRLDAHTYTGRWQLDTVDEEPTVDTGSEAARRGDIADEAA